MQFVAELCMLVHNKSSTIIPSMSAIVKTSISLPEP